MVDKERGFVILTVPRLAR
uniref:Uncharacterized protein n=1 Tax=Anguilla anguilla TaxID=7936 RepID=A0A0E9PV05_ANGAN